MCSKRCEDPRALRAALVFAAFVVIAVLVATVGRTPDLSRVKAAFLSGSQDGNYHAIVAKVAAEAHASAVASTI